MSDPRDLNLHIREALQISAGQLQRECLALAVVLNGLEGPFRRRMITLSERIGDLRDEVALIEQDVLALMAEEQKWLDEVAPQFN